MVSAFLIWIDFILFAYIGALVVRNRDMAGFQVGLLVALVSFLLFAAVAQLAGVVIA